MAEPTTPQQRAARELVAAFGQDVLGGWRTCKTYLLQPDGSYRARKPNRLVRPDDVYAHLAGDHTIAVNNIQRAIVIDADLGEKSNEASDDEKREALARIRLALDTFGLPSMTFDSRRGVHTWIRLDRNPTPDELDALRRILGAKPHGDFGEVFPHGDWAIRLPLGLYGGKRRGPLGATMEEAVTWLAKPERATEDALLALNEAGAKIRADRAAESRSPATPGPRLPATPLRAGIAAIQPLQKTIPNIEPVEPPSPIDGWHAWPRCKQRLAVEGPLAGHRHYAILALANEAVEQGEGDDARLLAFLLAVPTPHSNTPFKEHQADARHAIKDARKMHAEGDARRFTSCTHIPTHTDARGASTLRATFERFCGEPGACEGCPIYAAWHRGPTGALRYQHILDSPIWRPAIGRGNGLGVTARTLYEMMIRRAGGDENMTFQCALDYIGLRLANVTARRSSKSLRDRLIEHGLIERVGEKKKALFRLVYRDADWLRAKEAELGVTAAYERERAEMQKPHSK